MKYRICKNDYGYYKIQRYYELKIFGYLLKSGWRDTCFYIHSSDLMIFKTKEEAQERISQFIVDDQKTNDNWICT